MTTSPRGRHWSALLLVAVVAGVAVLAVWPLRTPGPRPASAPPTEFSAARALTHLGMIAARPHPTGSAAQEQVRGYLQHQLSETGLSPSARTRQTERTTSWGPMLATVTNVHAAIDGQDPTGRVLLVAHYDSVPTGPGAGDNGANVAAVLELVRALRAGAAPRNDVELLLTDGEEFGMLGAQAFVDQDDTGDRSRTVVVNLDARGVSGPAVMFESVGRADLAAVRASGAFATSASSSVYQLLGNDTDLTVFARTGMRGLNFAFVGGPGHYHTPHDDLDHLRAGSVQDIGDAALAAVRQLAAADLAPRPDRPTTLFSLPGGVLAYPAALDLPLAAIAVLAWLVLVGTGRRAGLSPAQVAWSALGLVVVLATAVLVGLTTWALLHWLRPELQLLGSTAYHPVRYVLGEALLVGVALIGWHGWVRRRATGTATAVGVVGLLATLALAAALLLPGASYLLTWPSLLGTATAFLVVRTGANSPWRLIVPGVTGASAAVVLVPLVVLLVPLLGLALAAVPLVLIALVVAALIGGLPPLASSRALVAALLVAAVGGSATLLASHVVDQPSPSLPRPTSLAYLLEDEPRRASWLSFGPAGVPAVEGRLTRSERLDDRLPPLRTDTLLTGPAAAADLAGPRATGTATGGRLRELRARLQAPEGTHEFFVYLDTTKSEVVRASIDGRPLAGGTNQPQAPPTWGWGCRYVGLPAAGVELRLAVRGPIRLRLVAVRAGLPGGVGAPALSPDTSWNLWPDIAGQTFLVRTLSF